MISWDDIGAVGGFIVAEPVGSQVIKAGFGEGIILLKDILPNHPRCFLFYKQYLEEKISRGCSGFVIESVVKKYSPISTSWFRIYQSGRS